jgi:hypothetical protein
MKFTCEAHVHGLREVDATQIGVDGDVFVALCSECGSEFREEYPDLLTLEVNIQEKPASELIPGEVSVFFTASGYTGEGPSAYDFDTYLAQIASVEATDSRYVTLRLREPFDPNAGPKKYYRRSLVTVVAREPEFGI